RGSSKGSPREPSEADAHLLRGKALLKLGKSNEGHAAIQVAHDFWQDFEPNSPWAAEAAFWYGQSLVAIGEAARGRRLMREVQPRLAGSFMPLHRELVQSTPAKS